MCCFWATVWAMIVQAFQAPPAQSNIWMSRRYTWSSVDLVICCVLCALVCDDASYIEVDYSRRVDVYNRLSYARYNLAE